MLNIIALVVVDFFISIIVAIPLSLILLKVKWLIIVLRRIYNLKHIYVHRTHINYTRSASIFLVGIIRNPIISDSANLGRLIITPSYKVMNSSL
jgi:hypothetical protein